MPDEPIWRFLAVMAFHKQQLHLLARWSRSRLDAIALLASPRPSASPLLLAGIADLMGHKDLATTQIYAKVEEQNRRSVVNKLTPLVPPEVSLKSVTRRTNAEGDDTKLLIAKGVEEDPEGLAEREGFEPSAQVLARATA
jgi:hypothetical protein